MPDNDIRNINHGRLIFCTWQVKGDRHWPLLFVSASIAKVLGYPEQDFLQDRLKFGAIVHPKDRLRARKEILQAVEDSTCCHHASSYRLRDSQGRYHYMETCEQIERNAAGTAVRVHSYLYDITPTMEKKVRLQLVLEGTHLGMWDWNPQTDAVVFDRNWATMLGYSSDELKPDLSTWAAHIHPADLKHSFKAIHDHVRGDTDRYEHVHRMQHKDGSWRWILDRGRVVEWDAKGIAVRFTGTHTDITPLKTAEQQLRQKNQELQRRNEELREHSLRIARLAKIDSLTGVFNRGAFDARIDEEFARWQRTGMDFSLIMLDIDYFKSYNDTYGHLAGDECLRLITRQLQRVVARSTDFIARFGGEEFVMILPDTPLDDALALAEQVRVGIEFLALEHIRSPVASVVTVSLGVTSTRELLAPPASSKALISLADQALYAAKNNGRNQWMSRLSA